MHMEILAAIAAAVAAEEGRPVRVVQVTPVGAGFAPSGGSPWAWAGRQEMMAARAQVLARPRGRGHATDAEAGGRRTEPRTRRRTGGGRGR